MRHATVCYCWEKGGSWHGLGKGFHLLRCPGLDNYTVLEGHHCMALLCIERDEEGRNGAIGERSNRRGKRYIKIEEILER